MAVVHVDADGIIKAFEHYTVAVDTVVHLPVVDITGKCYGLYLRMLFIFVVKLEIGVGFRGECSLWLCRREIDGEGSGLVWLEVDEKYEFVGAAVVIEVVELPRGVGLSFDDCRIDLLAVLGNRNNNRHRLAGCRLWIRYRDSD